MTAAIQPFNRALEICGRRNGTHTSLVVTYAQGNLMREANVIYHELVTKSKLSFVSPALLPIASAALDKNEQAIRYAWEAYRRRDPFQVISSNAWPDSKKLCSLPEYGEIIKFWPIDGFDLIKRKNRILLGTSDKDGPTRTRRKRRVAF